MTYGVHPLTVLAIAGVVLALAAVIAACVAKTGLVRSASLALVLVGLAPAGFIFLLQHPELTDGRFGAYKDFYRDLEPGMTREQVLATLEKHYPASGTRRPPQVVCDLPDRLGFFMDPEDSRHPNCEGIFLDMNNGRVTRKEYSPD